MKLLSTKRRGLSVLATAATLYVGLAYVVLPALWTHHEHEPGLASLPMVTRTGTGIPGRRAGSAISLNGAGPAIGQARL